MRVLVRLSARVRIQYKTSFFLFFWLSSNNHYLILMFTKMDSSDDIYSYRHIFMHYRIVSKNFNIAHLY